MARLYDRFGEDMGDDTPPWEREEDLEFADPGGGSALRAAGPGNPRNLPCPHCHFPNRLTPRDVALGYQCDACADAAERGVDPPYYEEEGEGR